MRKNKISFKSAAPAIFIIILLGGCVFMPHYEQLMVLKEFGANQSEMEDSVRKQGELFAQLESDLNNNQLKTGISKQEVLSIYGEPVICKEAASETGLRETCIYRNPTKKSPASVIYLNFDQDQKLSSWELIKK